MVPWCAGVLHTGVESGIEGIEVLEASSRGCGGVFVVYMAGYCYTYIVRCADGTLYTGWTTDLVRRVAAHNGHGGCGAKYTRARRPVTLVYAERWGTRREAMGREWRIKRMSREEKMRLVGWEGENI